MPEWNITSNILADRDVDFLFEIFELPVASQFTVRGGLVGLGKSRILIANQDQLQDALIGYIEDLGESQQQIVKELVQQYETVRTKVVKFNKAERVDFRVSAPDEERALIRRRLQVYIPIFTQQEVESYYENSGNEIQRG